MTIPKPTETDNAIDLDLHYTNKPLFAGDGIIRRCYEAEERVKELQQENAMLQPCKDFMAALLAMEPHKDDPNPVVEALLDKVNRVRELEEENAKERQLTHDLLMSDQQYRDRIVAMEAELAQCREQLDLWRPLTPEDAQAAYDAAEAEPLSQERIAEIVRKATDPAERLTNNEQAQLAVENARLLIRLCHSDKMIAEQVETISQLKPAPIPVSEWHEDDGDVLLWRFPVVEPPVVATADDADRQWPGHFTHFTRLAIPVAPADEGK